MGTHRKRNRARMRQRGMGRWGPQRAPLLDPGLEFRLRCVEGSPRLPWGDGVAGAADRFQRSRATSSRWRRHAPAAAHPAPVSSVLNEDGSWHVRHRAR